MAFSFPMRDRSLVSQVVGFDHDGVDDGDGIVAGLLCVDHAGRTFPYCYNAHDGTDYILEGGLTTMDAGSTAVIAAAPGWVVYAEDGNYDRCRGTLDGVDCDGHPRVANAVRLRHADGTESMYWHLKEGSVRVRPGDWADRGDELGLVGSSGYSSMPHLHFEVQLSGGTSVDPYADGAESRWCEQDAGDGLPGGC